MEQLRAARDAAAENARQGAAVVESFRDAAAINRYLDEGAKTVDLFFDIEKQDKKNAKRVFHTAEPALIKAKEYAACETYLDPKSDFSRMADGYRVTSDFENKHQAEGKRVPEFARNKFRNEAATLVALLTVNKRKPEAE